MKKIKYIKSLLPLVCVLLLLTGCEEDLDSPLSNFVGFEIGSSPFREARVVPENSTIEYEVKFYASETLSSDRTYQVSATAEDHLEFAKVWTGEVDDDAPAVLDFIEDFPYFQAGISLPSQVTIPAGSREGTFTFSVTDDANLAFENQYLMLDFVDESGRDFADPIAFPIAQECLDTIVEFNLSLDDWPDETTWEFYNLTDGAVLLDSGGPYSNPADDFVDLVFPYCLGSGTYGVVVFDSYGDGGPTFSVTSAGGTFVSDTTVSGTQSSATFTIN